MDWFDFGLLLYDNLPLYIGLLAISLLIYFLLFRRTYISLIDPLTVNLFFSVFGFSVVLFLYATESIQVKYFISYLLTQGAFFAGLLLFRPLDKENISNKPVFSWRFEKESLLVKILFIMCSTVYVITQLTVYKLVGIPLLMESRIGAFADTGGLGLLGRITDVLRPTTAFLCMYLLFQKNKSLPLKIYVILSTLFLLLSFALSGSKGQFMSLGFILFIYLLLNAGKLKSYFLNIRKYERYIIIAGLCFAFFTITVQGGNGSETDESILGVFLFRLVASGDTYYFAYPNNNIELINGSKGFLALFGDIFSVLRIIPRESQPTTLGLQLFQMFSDSDLIAGPNARHNVFGYVYYGFYGSIFFSFCIGVLLSFIRNKLFYKLKGNILGQLIFMLTYLNMCFLETDPAMAFSNFENVLLIFPPFVLTAVVIYVVLCSTRNKPALIITSQK